MPPTKVIGSRLVISELFRSIFEPRRTPKVRIIRVRDLSYRAVSGNASIDRTAISIDSCNSSDIIGVNRDRSTLLPRIVAGFITDASSTSSKPSTCSRTSEIYEREKRLRSA